MLFPLKIHQNKKKKHVVRDLLNVCNNNTTFGLSQSAASVSDTPVRLKQDQSHQTWYESLDPKQDSNKAKTERPCLKTVSKKNKLKKPTFLKILSNQEARQISPLNECES